MRFKIWLAGIGDMIFAPLQEMFLSWLAAIVHVFVRSFAGKKRSL